MADSGKSNNQQGASGSEERPNTKMEVIQYLEGQVRQNSVIYVTNVDYYSHLDF